MPNPKNSAAPRWCSATWLSPCDVPRGKGAWLRPPTQACGASLSRCLQAKGSPVACPLCGPRGLLLEPPGVHGNLTQGCSRAISPKVSTWAQGVTEQI